MAVRKIIQIDEEKCNGCGICVDACHEGAIALVDGVAKLVRDDYCDGFGDCLPECPAGAISFVEREAAAYNEAAVEANKRAKAQAAQHAGHGGGCPGSAMRTFAREDAPASAAAGAAAGASAAAGALTSETVPNEITTWPIQIKLVNPMAPYFSGCDLLVAADCTAFAYGNFHHDYMKGKVTVIGCPKLDAIDYSEKLGQILLLNNVRSVTLARMIVPCCGGLEAALQKAIAESGKDLQLNVVTFNLDGTPLV